MEMLILVVTLTITFSALCSFFEATLFSTRIGAIEAAKTGGRHRGLAEKMLDMKMDITVPISSILILNTIANTGGSILSGMYAQIALGSKLVLYFSILFSISFLFLCEIIPKTIGAIYWRSFWPLIVIPITLMQYILYPIILVIQKFSSILTRERPIPLVSEEEILGFVCMGAKEGEISFWESQMVHNIILLEDIPVKKIMTPKSVMVTVEENTSVMDTLDIIGKKGFTRIPVYRKNENNLTGYVIKHDLVLCGTDIRPDTPVSSFARLITFFKDTDNCLFILATFLKKRGHIAIVKDSAGRITGLVILEDILETILGAEIVDEKDRFVDLQKAALR